MMQRTDSIGKGGMIVSCRTGIDPMAQEVATTSFSDFGGCGDQRVTIGPTTRDLLKSSCSVVWLELVHKFCMMT